MANRYWVGNGAATWNTTGASSGWATTSGGAAGQTIPTAADDVFFDASSPACTLATSGVCRSLNFVDGTAGAYTNTFTHTTNMDLSIGDATTGAGNIALKFSAGMTYTPAAVNSRIVFVSTSTTQQTVTWAGKTPGNVLVSGANGNWQIQDAWNAPLTTVTYSSTSTAVLDINGQTCSWALFVATNGSVKTLTLGAAQITCNNWAVRVGTVITANTATVFQTGTASQFDNNSLGGCDYNGMSLVQNGSGFTNVGLSSSAPATTITLANYTRTGTNNIYLGTVFGFHLTVTGTLQIDGFSNIYRPFIESSVLGTSRTITAAVMSASTDNVDFQDINGAGAANWDLSARSVGDCLGNTGITFPAPVTRYAIMTANRDWSNTAMWSTTSGGATGASFPLPQDTAIFDNNTMSAARIVTPDLLRACRNLDTSGLTNFTMQIGRPAANVVLWFFGNVDMSAVSSINTTSWHVYLGGRSTHTWTPPSGTVNTTVNVASPGGSYTMTRGFTSPSAFNHLAGTLDTGSFNITTLSSNVTTPTLERTLILGTTTWTLTGTASAWNMTATSSFTLSAANSTIIFSTASTTARSFVGGSNIYGTVTYTVADSPGTLTITGNNYFDTLNVGPGRVLSLTTLTTQTVRNWNVNGVNWGYQRLTSTGSNYVTIPDSAATSWSGDFDVRLRLNADAWAQVNMSLTGKRTTSSTGYAWLLTMNSSSKQPQLSVSSNGTTATNVASGLAVPFADGADGWIRVTWRASDGRVQFFTSTDATNDPSSVTWTQLGTDKTANVGSIFDSPAAIIIGGYDTAAVPVFNGRFYRAQYRNNILDNGTGIVADVDFTTKPFGADTFTESSSNAATVSIVGTIAQAGDGRVLITSSSAQTGLVKPWTDSYGNMVIVSGNVTNATFNSDNLQITSTTAPYLYTPESAALSLTGDMDLRARVNLPDWTPATTGYLISKRGGASNSTASYQLYVNPTGTLTLFISDGVGSTASTSSVATGLTDGTTQWVRATRRVSDGRVQFWLGGSGSTPTWVQLGTDQSNTRAGQDTTDAVVYNSQYAAGSAVGSIAMSLYNAQIRNNVLDDGTGIVLDIAFDNNDTPMSSDYLTVNQSKAGGGSAWYAGANSADKGSNFGWIFTAPPSGGTSASAESISATGVANGLALLINPSAYAGLATSIVNAILATIGTKFDLITASGVANDAAISTIDPIDMAVTATGSSAASNATTTVSSGIGTSSSSGVSDNAASKIATSVFAIAISGTANNATTSTLVATNVAPDTATATGVASNVISLISVRPNTITAISAANGISGKIVVIPAQALGIGSAIDNDSTIANSVSSSSAVGTAYQVTITTIDPITTTQVAGGSGVANNTGNKINPIVYQANAAAMGENAVANVVPSVPEISATGIAYDPVLYLFEEHQAFAITASALAEAIDATVFVVNASFVAPAEASGTAYGATLLIDLISGEFISLGSIDIEDISNHSSAGTMVNAGGISSNGSSSGSSGSKKSVGSFQRLP